MMSASATAARARLRQVVHRLTVAERAALAAAAALGLAAVAAIHADAAGREWPDVATALIAAGLGASLLAAGIGWAIVGSATALARRVDVAATLGSQALDELRTLRVSIDAMRYAVQDLMQRQREADRGSLESTVPDLGGTVGLIVADLRAVIAELGRLRMDARDREVMIADMRAAMAQMERRHQARLREVARIAVEQGYRAGQEVAEREHEAARRDDYWRVYADVLEDLAGEPPSEQ